MRKKNNAAGSYRPVTNTQNGKRGAASCQKNSKLCQRLLLTHKANVSNKQITPEASPISRVQRKKPRSSDTLNELISRSTVRDTENVSVILSWHGNSGLGCHHNKRQHMPDPVHRWANHMHQMRITSDANYVRCDWPIQLRHCVACLRSMTFGEVSMACS